LLAVEGWAWSCPAAETAARPRPPSSTQTFCSLRHAALRSGFLIGSSEQQQPWCCSAGGRHAWPNARGPHCSHGAGRLVSAAPPPWSRPPRSDSVLGFPRRLPAHRQEAMAGVPGRADADVV